MLNIAQAAADREYPLDAKEVQRRIEYLLQNQEGYPTSICRDARGVSTTATLFSICMDLGSRKGRVRMGRPTEVEEVIVLDPCEL